jgi:Family of unknown function (DUF6314)
MSSVAKGIGQPSASHSLVAALFYSLVAQGSSRWSLTRQLRSDNLADFNGQLKGIATFTPLPSAAAARDPADADGDADVDTPQFSSRDILYREEGEMPPSTAAGHGMVGLQLRWTKTYIWRLHDRTTSGRDEEAENKNGKETTTMIHGISVWFVKMASELEADYLFHEFEFDDNSSTDDDPIAAAPTPPPIPPTASAAGNTSILTARGNHLCVNDLYHTAYSFRIRDKTGEVLSWASRHVVKGPKKNQDIVNVYERETVQPA